MTNLMPNSFHPTGIPGDVRIDLSLTLVWGPRGEAEDQERTSSFGVTSLASLQITVLKAQQQKVSAFGLSASRHRAWANPTDTH